MIVELFWACFGPRSWFHGFGHAAHQLFVPWSSWLWETETGVVVHSVLPFSGFHVLCLCAPYSCLGKECVLIEDEDEKEVLRAPSRSQGTGSDLTDFGGLVLKKKMRLESFLWFFVYKLFIFLVEEEMKCKERERLVLR